MVLEPSVLALIRDPLSLAIVSGLASGCIDPFVSHAIEHGISWVSDSYKGHPNAAIRAAQNNAVNFLKQVDICLKGQLQVKSIEDKTKQALADPDYTILIQMSMAA